MVAVVEPKETTALAVQRGQEVVVRRKNEIGILFQISTLLSDRDVNILGVNAGVCGEDCLIRFITDNNRKAKDVLAANNFTPGDESVVLVELPHRPGMLKQVTKTLAQDGIDIRHVYAASTREQDKCLLVFHSSNDEGAIAKLKEIKASSSEGEDIFAEDRQADEGENTNMVSEGGPTY
jgi:hypothetical protein